MKSIVEMKHIKMLFGEKQALDDINISVAEGEIFGLLGPSGAGKTTMIKILTGQLAPTAGEASIFGEKVNGIKEEVYERIGMVLDTSGLYSRLTCYDNLKVFAEIHGIDKSIIDWVLEVVQLSDVKKKQVSKLSKGMAQRLVFARAILHDPDLLFLDEPTSGLDPATAQEIHRLIFELRRRGTTIFMTTHNMSEATLLCDHVALLNEGNIAEYGEPEALCRKYDSRRKLHICLKNGEEVELANAPESAEWVSYYIKEGMLESIHSSEPDLATVFIDLTGRKLM